MLKVYWENDLVTQHKRWGLGGVRWKASRKNESIIDAVLVESYFERVTW